MSDDQPIWTTYDGKRIHISDMGTAYLRAAFKKLTREIAEAQALHCAMEVELSRRTQATLATISIQPPSRSDR